MLGKRGVTATGDKEKLFVAEVNNNQAHAPAKLTESTPISTKTPPKLVPNDPNRIAPFSYENRNRWVLM